MISALDHVVSLCEDIERAVNDHTLLFARTPSRRERRDGAAIAVFALDNTSLELMAPDGDGALGARVRAALDAEGEGLKSLAFATDDIAAAHRRASRLDLKPSEIASPSGRASFRLDGQATHGLRLFIIAADRTEPPSTPLATSAVTGMDHIVVGTPAPDRAAALYGARLGLDMALDRTNPEWGSRLMFFRCGDMIVEVAHRLAAGLSDGPDTLFGMTWRIDDAQAAQARLGEAGFNVSEVRNGRKPGTRVFTVRDRTSGVPTLMLQPSPAKEG